MIGIQRFERRERFPDREPLSGIREPLRTGPQHAIPRLTSRNAALTQQPCGTVAIATARCAPGQWAVITA